MRAGVGTETEVGAGDTKQVESLTGAAHMAAKTIIMGAVDTAVGTILRAEDMAMTGISLRAMMVI